MKRKAISIMLSAALIAGTLVGCGSDNSAAESTTDGNSSESSTADGSEGAETADSSDGETEGSSKYKDFITVDVFDSMANYQGIQSGWFAMILFSRLVLQQEIWAT